MSILAHLPSAEVEDGDLTPYRKEYMERMRSWSDLAYDEAARTLKLSKEYDRASDYISYLEGDGWWPRGRARFLSGFFDNRLQHTRYSTLALLTDLRPTIDVRSRIPAFQPQANAAQGIIHYEWYNQALDLSLVSVVDAAMLFGNGFWKIGASTPGSMTFTACGPDMVMPIQPGFTIQDSTAILFRTYKPISYFVQRWPERCAHLEEESTSSSDQYQGTMYGRPPRVDEYTWTNMSPQMKAKIGLKASSSRPDATPYPVIELREFWVDDMSLNESVKPVLMRAPHIPLDEQNFKYWVEPGQPLYPRKRLIVFAGNRLMYDGPSPYWHGLFPFAMLRMNPTMWSFWGLSKYRDLIPINKGMNEIVAGTLDLCKRALNPQVVTKEGGVPKAAWDSYFPNMPGGKLRLGPGANIADIKYMDVPQLPAYVYQTLLQLSQEYDRLAGSTDVNKLAGKKQVPGGDSIEQMRDIQNTAIRLEGRYIEAFLRDAGQIAIPNIFQMYSASRRLRVLGADGLTWEDFDYNPNDVANDNSGMRMIPSGIPPEDHVKNFSLDIAPGTLLGTNKERQKLMALSLFKASGISRAALLRALEIPPDEIKQIEQEILKEHKEGIGPAGRGGTPRMTRSARQGGEV